MARQKRDDYLWTCDGCGIEEATQLPERPPGWLAVKIDARDGSAEGDVCTKACIGPWAEDADLISSGPLRPASSHAPGA